MEINKNTTISIFAVGTAVPSIVGAILWLSAVATDAKEAKTQVTELSKLVLDIRDTLSRIEERINYQSGRRK